MIPVRKFKEYQYSQPLDSGRTDSDGYPSYRYLHVRLSDTSISVHVHYSDNAPEENYEAIVFMVGADLPSYVYEVLANVLAHKHFEEVTLPSKARDKLRGSPRLYAN